jgi:hypothetical protein
MQLHFVASAALLLCVHAGAAGQSTQQPAARPGPTPAPPQQQRPPAPRPVPASSFDITDYGVQIEPEPRLVVMMAALTAAGWDPTPAGESPTVFRETVAKDQAGLDPELRRRMQEFYRRYALKDAEDNPQTPENEAARYTPADQAARYVSLAYTLGPAPAFDAPPRTDDLPVGVLDVLDFVPLLRDFYRQSGMAERLPAYLRMYREEGDRLRRPTAEMVKSVLSYLHTRPQLSVVETVKPSGPEKKDSKKSDQPRRATLVREKQRRFIIVPDLLAAPGAINFRVIRDDYYAVAPFGTNPASSELRRGYIQYVLDPLILRYGRAVADKRAAVKQLLDEQRARNPNVTPDVFLSVARSLVVAADVRVELTERLAALQRSAAERLRTAAGDAARAEASRQTQAESQRLEDEAVARLAEAYERGAVLSFHFADQLRGLETSGFDISNFFADMVGAIDPAREGRRLAESADAVRRHREARARAHEAAARETAEAPAASEAQAALLKSLGDVNELLRLRNHVEAEARLRALQREHPQEPRVYFGLAQATSLSAQDAFDPALQEQRLKTALSLYQQSIAAASPDTHAALISRAHAASGRILAHLERTAEAAAQFDAAIRLGDVKGGAYREAMAERQKLNPQP